MSLPRWLCRHCPGKVQRGINDSEWMVQSWLLNSAWKDVRREARDGYGSPEYEKAVKWLRTRGEVIVELADRELRRVDWAKGQKP